MRKVRGLACGVTLVIALTGASPASAGVVASAPAADAVAAREPVTVRVTPLDGLAGPGGDATVADINERGVAVGSSQAAGGGGRHAVVWAAATPTDLTPARPAEASDAAAVALNDRGAIVGADGIDRYGGGEVFLWEDGAEGPVTALPLEEPGMAVDITNRGLVLYAEFINRTPGGYTALTWDDGVVDRAPPLPPTEVGMFGTDVNERGLVTGIPGFIGGWLAGTWRPGGPATALPLPDGALGAMAFALNDRGDVVGQTYPDTVTPPAVVRWRDGVPQRLVGPSGEPSQVEWVLEPRGGSPINRRGDVVGVIAGEGYGRATLWRDGVAAVLPSPEGVPYAAASAVNDRRQVVGWGLVDGERHGLAWSDGRVVDLTALAGEAGAGGTTTLTDINDRGQVVGHVQRPDGTTRAYRWDLPARL